MAALPCTEGRLDGFAVTLHVWYVQRLSMENLVSMGLPELLCCSYMLYSNMQPNFRKMRLLNV